MSLPPLLSLRDIKVTFGGKPLFENLSLHVTRGEKHCLVGRNGCGKSTLLKLIAGLIDFDQGERYGEPGVRLSYLPQDVIMAPDHTAFDYIKMGDCESYQAEMLMDQLLIPKDRPMAGFSGGERRRVALARALVSEPDILLLDEPTNHLDLPTIEWLENYILQFRGALITISHDRRFLEKVSTSCLWLDRGILREHGKGYGDFENWSHFVMEEDLRHLDRLNVKLKQETEWLHRGVTARRRRNQGRLRRLMELRAHKRDVMSNQLKRVKMGGMEGDFGSKMLIEAKDISKFFGERLLIKNFSTRILRGDRIGIIGPNGSGKTTLVRLLAGLLEPDEGSVKIGKAVEMLYFDQMRDSLNPRHTLWETLCETGGDHVSVQGQPRHVMAYLKDFLFAEKQVRSPVSILSGGERNRLALAKAFTKPSNLMILDEPTNDLDMDTLDLLQELLSEYEGTLLIVSHDRDFLEKITTTIMGVRNDGTVQECVGGYNDFIQHFPFHAPRDVKSLKSVEVKSVMTVSSDRKKITFKDQHAYAQLPRQMEAIGQEISHLEHLLADADLYQQDSQKFSDYTKRLEELQKNLHEAELKWLELDELLNS